jgi:hypothetical protein
MAKNKLDGVPGSVTGATKNVPDTSAVTGAAKNLPVDGGSVTSKLPVDTSVVSSKLPVDAGSVTSKLPVDAGNLPDAVGQAHDLLAQIQNAADLGKA